ncbi:MAG TPA: hypothetical protein VFU55_10085 [Terracidiphilus sp.]|nr:hypothetical protein [Terracidiphilus sp.]
MRVAVRMATVCALAMVLQCAFGADASGNWTGSFDFQGASVNLTFHLKIAGSALTGTIDGLGPAPTEIHDGKVAGDTLSFWVNSDYQGQTYQLMYQGKLSGDSIDFNFGTPDGSWSAEVLAKRGMEVAAAPDVSGNWSGAFDFQGNSIPLTFHLKNADGAVTGYVDGLPTSPVEIHDGKVAAGTLTFWLNTDYQGQTYRLDYSGKVAADHIDFSFGTEDGSWGATLTATKAAAAPVAPAAAPATAPAGAAAPAATPAPTGTPAPTSAPAPSSPQD